jgi:UrcA family protein
MRSPRLARWVIPATVTLACAIASATASGQDSNDQEVRIKGQPVITTEGWNRFGIRNQKVELSQDISYADLNLATRSGANQLKDRVRDAAKVICTKLGHYDEGRGAIASEEDQISCVNGAVDDAMVQVKRAIESEQTRPRG